MITYLKTDIFTSTADTLVCPVNTAGVMGAGLAKQFRLKFPEMHIPYIQACRSGRLRIGKLWTWRGARKSVLCFPTKGDWRCNSHIEDIIFGLRAFQRQRNYSQISHIAFPKLGCGCGGLSWNVVRLEMERYLGDLPIQIDVHI